MALSTEQSTNFAAVTSSPEVLSPGGKSRYGRARRPKISQDFYNIDDVFIDENPLPPVKSPKLKSPLASPISGREILFEIKDEFTRLDDLGMKVANNFKTNLQRGLDDSIKQRKFFKSMPDNKLDIPNVVDVTKVLKLISKPITNFCEIKSTPKTTLRTYSNRKKHVHDSDSFVVESFGLPDQPIIPLNSLVTHERNSKIDVEINTQTDVNLKRPWMFDEFPPVPIYTSDMLSDNFHINTNTAHDLMTNTFTENLEVATVVEVRSTCLDKTAKSLQSVVELGDVTCDKIHPQDNGGQKVNSTIHKSKRVTKCPKILSGNVARSGDFVENIITDEVKKSKKNFPNSNTKVLKANNFPKSNTKVLKANNKQLCFDGIEKPKSEDGTNLNANSKQMLFGHKIKKLRDKGSIARNPNNKKQVVKKILKNDGNVTSKTNNQRLISRKKAFNEIKISNNEESIKASSSDSMQITQKSLSGNDIKNADVEESVNCGANSNKQILKNFKSTDMCKSDASSKRSVKKERKLFHEIKKSTSEGSVDKKQNEGENRRILRSSVNTINDEVNRDNLALSLEQEKEEVSLPNISQKSLRSNTPNLLKIPSPKLNYKLINPASVVCNSQLRVVLNPLAHLKEPFQELKQNKKFVINPIKIKAEQSRQESEHTSSNINMNGTSTVIGIKKSLIKKKEECDSKDIISQEIIEYEVGDLAWAKIGTHPYWPCMVTEEPASKLHKKTIGSRHHPYYHVRFFGDRGRRSWVSAQRIMLYYNRDDLEKMANLLRKGGKIKSSYIKESYEVKLVKLEKWQGGVREAETLKFKNIKERLNHFVVAFGGSSERKDKVGQLLVKQEITGNEIKSEFKENPIEDRKRSRESAGSKKNSPKKLRVRVKHEFVEGQEIFEQVKTKDEIKKEQEKNGVNTVEESSCRDFLSPESKKKNGRKTIFNQELNEKNRPTKFRKKNQDMTEAQRKSQHSPVKEAATESAQNQNKTKRNSFEVCSSQEAEENEDFSLKKIRNKRHQIPGEYSNSDTDSKFSDNSSVPASLESQAALFRRNNIFRGISRDKVCQICEKTGEVFKCKGPCNGVYHYKCAMPVQIKKDETEEKKVPVKQEVKQEPSDAKSNVEIIAVSTKQPLPNLSTSPNFKGMTLAEKIDFRMKEIMKKFDYQSVYSELTDSSSEEFIADESLDKIDNCLNKTKSKSKLSLTVTTKPSKKEVPIIKHVTADNINYICVTNERPKEKTEIGELPKDTLKHFKCTWCFSEQIPHCLICNKEDSRLGLMFRQKCSLHQCGKYYHSECLKMWPQTQWSLINSTKDKKSDASYDTFVCPRHMCHTCISDDPRAAANSRCPSDKVVKCLRCPATYHSSSYCVPAGTHILSSSQIICPRHYSKQNSARKHSFQQTINANWCFICSKGGNLICCETCPTSVHVECLPGDLNEDDTFYCEDCQSGRLPLYDEIVWVKLGTFRWWPALILFPNEVPDNVRNRVHNKGEFVVKFFGTYDHYWVGRGRTFLFQEGDKGHSNPIRRKVDSAFVKAIEEAAAAHQLKKQFKVSKIADKITGLKPPPYIRIKVNKPVGNVRLCDGNTSNTTSCDCDPNQPHPCGPDSDCLNRLLLTECNPEVCPAGERCNNQCFEKREYPPLVPHRTQVRGWGLKTLAPVRKGQFVIEYVGEIIDDQEYQRRIHKMHQQKEENYYFLTIDKDRTLDAGPKGNVARFMNHSCQPNCETQKWTVNGNTRVGLFAQCDIPAGTELTFNYNLECIGKEKKICRCGAPNCSGFIGVKVKSDVPQKKSSNPKKKKTPTPASEIIKENPCFVCGKLGNVGACNNKICAKHYHLECAGMKAWPDGGKWVCQWHNCNLCSKRTIRCCVKCVNSFCPSHSEGYIRYDKLLGFVCSDHDPTRKTSEIEVNSTSTANIDSTIEEVAATSTTSEEVAKEDADDDILDSMSLQTRLNGWMTSTPLKKVNEDSSQDENVVTSASTSKSKGNKNRNNSGRGGRSKKSRASKTHVKNTANVRRSGRSGIKPGDLTPIRHLRTNRKSIQDVNTTDVVKDLPIRKLTRHRNTL